MGSDDCDDCDGLVEVEPGMYKMRRCEECRKEAFSIESRESNRSDMPLWPLYVFLLLAVGFLLLLCLLPLL